MEDAWAYVFSYLPPREILKCERVSKAWRQRAHRALHQMDDVDFEPDFPGALADSARLERILREEKNEKFGRHCCVPPVYIWPLCAGLCGRRLRKVTFRVTPRNEKYAVFASEHHVTRAVVEALGRGQVFDHFVLDESILLLLPISIRDLSISAGGSLKITNLNFLKGKLIESLSLQRSLVSSADLTELEAMAPSLTTLDLSSCLNITDGSALGKLNNLRYLYLGNNRDLSDESLLRICAGCPRLQHLSLDNCSLLSSISLPALGGLSELEWLCLAGVSGVDDSVLQALANCRQLQTLDIKFCRKVTEVGLMIVFDFPVLFHLEVQGVRAYSKELLLHARRLPKTILSDFTDTPVFIVPTLPSAVVG
ncbi:unnamed protein product [Angiostrongylus costaricensis]|uniref:F-box domain-containing protein n=1 Tax=Angiostrongylus costaricensis TaxID=334426 RepID=A0A158PFB0_ANGCS|nr:unnamed protein product [Angiostrongylus costaricensis]